MGRRPKPPQICHFCKLLLASRYVVPCKLLCGQYFCRRCLTSQYKYSRQKCAKLPSRAWRCPVCTNKCGCESCKETAIEASDKGKAEVKEHGKTKAMIRKGSEKLKENDIQNNKRIHWKKRIIGFDIRKTNDKCLRLKIKQPLPPFSSIRFVNYL